jgi:hypothetical protein
LEFIVKGWIAMGSRVRRSKGSLLDKELRSISAKGTTERLGEMLENVSLKNVPLEERRREAQKPLFLTRYE